MLDERGHRDDAVASRDQVTVTLVGYGDSWVVARSGSATPATSSTSVMAPMHPTKKSRADALQSIVTISKPPNPAAAALAPVTSGAESPQQGQGAAPIPRVRRGPRAGALRLQSRYIPQIR